MNAEHLAKTCIGEQLFNNNQCNRCGMHSHCNFFLVSGIKVNKNPTRCNSMQIFIYCKVTLHVSGVTAHHQEY